jgi:hypothetical protein
VADATWSSQGGVLTTNLYGLPDREAGLRAHCDRLGIPLTEDAATPPDRGRPPGHPQLGAAAFGLLKQAPPPTVGSTGRMAPLLPTQQPRVVDLEAAVFDVR